MKPHPSHSFPSFFSATTACARCGCQPLDVFEAPLPCRPNSALDEMAAAVGPPPQPTEDDACTN